MIAYCAWIDQLDTAQSVLAFISAEHRLRTLEMAVDGHRKSLLSVMIMATATLGHALKTL
jgi:hypothetical protein